MKRIFQILMVMAICFAGFTLAQASTTIIITNTATKSFAAMACVCTIGFTGPINGWVKNSSNNPVKNILVEATNPNNAFDYHRDYTDDNGYYSMNGSYCTDYNVSVRRTDAPTVQSVTTNLPAVCPGAAQWMDITYNATCGSGSYIDGYVLDILQQGIPSRTVRIHHDDTGSNYTDVTTNSSGYFILNSGLTNCLHYKVEVLLNSGEQVAPIDLSVTPGHSYDAWNNLIFSIR